MNEIEYRKLVKTDPYIRFQMRFALSFGLILGLIFGFWTGMFGIGIVWQIIIIIFYIVVIMVTIVGVTIKEQRDRKNEYKKQSNRVD